MTLGISACGALGSAPVEAPPSPAPTSFVTGLQVVPSAACQVAEQAMIRVEHPQGDLIAWSPVADSVAYVASTQSSSWNVGDLNLLTAPSFDKPIRLASQVAGELSWSPGGLTLAFLGLRRSDNLYTVGLAYPDGRASRDLFPGEAARTDVYSSQKAILEWMGDGRLRVLISCGIDCLQGLDFGILSGLSSPTGDSIKQMKNLWTPHTSQLVNIPPEYTDLPGQLNWSPDEDHIAYLDEKGKAWFIDVKAHSIYPLDIGAYGTADETDWSFDNRYLAVKVDQNLKIYTFECP